MTNQAAFKKRVRALAMELGIPYAEARTRILEEPTSDDMAGTDSTDATQETIETSERERGRSLVASGAAHAEEPVVTDYAALIDDLGGGETHDLGSPGQGHINPLAIFARDGQPTGLWCWWGPILNARLASALRESGEDTRVDFLGSTVIGRWSFVSTGGHDVRVLDEDGVLVEPLPHVKRHSSTGFGWGYEGSGAADLALSVLTYVLGSYDPAGLHGGSSPLPLAAYQAFKREVVAGLPRKGGWTLTLREVEDWVHEQRVTVQPGRDDGALPLAFHLYPGGVIGQQDVYRCDPWLVVGFGDHGHVEVFRDDFWDDPETAVGQRLIARDDDVHGTLAAYSSPIASVRDPRVPC